MEQTFMNGFISEDLYKKILQCLPISCVDIAIIAQGAVLLVKRKDFPAKGQWWLPGGRVLKGEMMKETALRKAREEVGLECHAGPIIYTAERFFPTAPLIFPYTASTVVFSCTRKPGPGSPA